MCGRKITSTLTAIVIRDSQSERKISIDHSVQIYLAKTAFLHKDSANYINIINENISPVYWSKSFLFLNFPPIYAIIIVIRFQLTLFIGIIT